MQTRSGRFPSRSTRAVAIAASSLVALSASADAPSAAAPLTVRLALKNSTGQIGCQLFNSEKGFPTDPSFALQRKWCPISSAESVCAFDSIPAGTYAIACFHDENKNGKLDTGLFGRPVEGTVASNNAKGFMGPPKFADAKFPFPGTPTELRLKMNY